MKVSELRRQISKDLGLLKEAYIVQPQKININTEQLSVETKNVHQELYEGYVEKLNTLSAELDTVNRDAADSRTSGYRSLKQDEIWNRNAVQLHELFFSNIGDPQSELAFDSLPFMRLNRDWGTFDDWQIDFIATAMAARNGWAVTAFDPFLQRYVNFFIDGHASGIPIGCYPILVIDVWEHAYIKDYKTNREEYIINMMQEINWDVVDLRVSQAELLQR